MKYLKAFLTSPLTEKDDLSVLPEDMMKEIKKIMKKAAHDLNQNFSNALELVHKAYSEAGVERPQPDMKGAWRQYEENIQLAVEQLAAARGLDGAWRMSSSVFHENAIPTKPTFHVQLTTPFAQEEVVVEAENMQEIIDNITDLMKKDPKNKDCLVKVEKHDKHGRKVTFWLHNAKKNCELLVIPNQTDPSFIT